MSGRHSFQPLMKALLQSAGEKRFHLLPVLKKRQDRDTVGTTRELPRIENILADSDAAAESSSGIPVGE